MVHFYQLFDHLKRADMCYLQMLQNFLYLLLELISHLIHIKAIHMPLSIQRYMNGFYYANFDRKEKQVI